METFSSCPERAEPSSSLFFALDSALFLRHEVDGFETGSETERTQLRQELAMLRHWLETADSGFDEYQALGEALVDFADSMQRRFDGV